MRKKKHGEERMARCLPLLIADPEAEKEARNNEPSFIETTFHIELGCGKGGFITALAAANPGVNYIAAERVRDVLLLAMEKALPMNLPNLKFINGDCALVDRWFATESVGRIYLNFSDPWPKRKQSIRRLTHGNFLEKYRAVMAPGAELHMKTDDRAFFEFSLSELRSHGFSIVGATYDLHGGGIIEGSIMTEYESYFAANGVPVCMCVAVKE